MSYLKMEVMHYSQWVPVNPVLRKGDPPGSLSHNTLEERQIVMFYCLGDHSEIMLTSFGLDRQEGSFGRVVITPIFSTGLTKLAKLKDGEQYEMEITTDRGISAPFRWTHMGDGNDD
jgi:hypothetical protein